MEAGCGVRIREFGSRRYFYFWHYEQVEGRSVRRDEYVGPVRSSRARDETLHRVAAHFRRLEQDLARRRARIERIVSQA